MKYLSVFISLLYFAVVSANTLKPIIHYDFNADKLQNNLIINLAGNKYQGRINGQYAVTSENSLQMNGRNTSIEICDSKDLLSGNEMTFAITYRKNTPPDNSRSDLNMDALASRKKSFIIGRLANNLYANLHDGKKWNANFQAQGVFRSAPGDWHHIALTVRYVNNINEAEEFTEMVFFFDGKKVKQQRFDNVRFSLADYPIEIGSATSMGTQWFTGGEIAEVKIFDKALNGQHIRELVLDSKLVSADFSGGTTLNKTSEAKINSLSLSPSLKSAIRNIALADYRRPSWEKIALEPQKYLTEIYSNQSVLTVLNGDGFSHIVSWYDLKNSRELLAPRSSFVSWTFERENKLRSIDPLNNNVKSNFHAGTKNSDFFITYEHRPTRNFPFSFKGKSYFNFENDQLTFSHTAECLSENAIIHTVEYPKIGFNTLNKKSEKLLIPNGPGVVEDLPTVRNFKYSNPYPRAFCSMQFGAYYDDKCGIFFCAADPHGRSKKLTFEGHNESLDINFSYRVPYDHAGTPNKFDMQSSAIIKLFSGDWFDAAMLYRNVLAEIKAPWFMRKINTPDFFKNNCYWLHEAYFGFVENDFIKLKNYIGLDCCRVDTWSWWEKGKCVYLSPVMRADPQWIEYMKHMRKNGIRVIPYTNGRLWAQLDVRGEDIFYSKYGKPNTVLSDGVRKQEKYAVPCDVICPATSDYQKIFSEFFIRIGSQGADGIYIDQLGATQHFPCHDSSHGHKPADYDAWNLNGYVPMLKKVRNTWEKRKEEKFLTTEDNAEFLVGLIDGMQGYRWTNQGQVPAFHAVYAGKVQYYNRRAASIDAKIQTLAEQLLYGEQLGAFTVREMTFPFLTEFRHYAKKIIYLRHALLPFFNNGKMMKSENLKINKIEKPLLFSMFGSKYVSKPSIQTATWQYGNTNAVILINSSAEKIRDTVLFSLEKNNNETIILHSNGSEEILKNQKSRNSLDFELAPREFILIISYPSGEAPQKLLADIRNDFKIISSVPKEQDPYSDYTAETKVTGNCRKPINLVDSILIAGARRNRKERFVDFNYLTFIYAGLFDFGTESPGKISIEAACTRSFCGAVQVYADAILPENKIAEITIDEKFKTASNKDFKYITVPLLKKVTGKKHLIFTCDGFFTYNLRSWFVSD